jgi:glyoxylase-like metal-dependent hydrolase (beta-lactamase superfamily II)
MKLTFLGSGSFFAGPKNYHSNILLETDKGHRLLLDCGSDARFSLAENGYKPTDVHGVYISHLHDDHCGGLEWFGYARYFVENRKRPELIFHESLQTDLWEHRLAVSMEALTEEVGTLKTYFRPYPVQKGFSFDGIHFRIVPVVHVVNHLVGHMMSYGLFITVNGVKVYWTSDMAYPNIPLEEGVWDYEKHWQNYVDADFIFHDCETVNASDVHPHYTLLNSFPPEIKRKMWLYHTQAAAQPDAKADGFLGIVKKSQSFKF